MPDLQLINLFIVSQLSSSYPFQTFGWYVMTYPTNYQGQGQGRKLMATFDAWCSIDLFIFQFLAIRHFFLKYHTWNIWPWKFKVKVMANVKIETHIWDLKFNWHAYFFVMWQSDQSFLRYSKTNIWPWKLKVKVKAKVKSNGDIWGLASSQYIHWSWLFCPGIYIKYSNWIFDLQRSRPWPRLKLMATCEP